MNLIKRKIIKQFLEYCANREYDVTLRQWDEYGPVLAENLGNGWMRVF